MDLFRIQWFYEAQKSAMIAGALYVWSRSKICEFMPSAVQCIVQKVDNCWIICGRN